MSVIFIYLLQESLELISNLFSKGVIFYETKSKYIVFNFSMSFRPGFTTFRLSGIYTVSTSPINLSIWLFTISHPTVNFAYVFPLSGMVSGAFSRYPKNKPQNIFSPDCNLNHLYNLYFTMVFNTCFAIDSSMASLHKLSCDNFFSY